MNTGAHFLRKAFHISCRPSSPLHAGSRTTFAAEVVDVESTTKWEKEATTNNFVNGCIIMVLTYSFNSNGVHRNR